MENVAFEEIEPQGRAIPQPNIYGHLYDLSTEMKKPAEEKMDRLIGNEMRSFRSDLLT